jgi:hypothetical protein
MSTQSKHRLVPSMDLIAALQHDRRIAKAEGFNRVAQRATDHIEWLEATLDEMAKINGGEVNLKVEISVSADF